MDFSFSRRRLFFLLCGLLAVGNLLVMNDVATLWDGAEARFVWMSLFESPRAYFPFRVVAAVSGGGVHEMLLRLPGVLLLVTAAAGVYGLVHPVLGRAATGWWLLVLATSLLIPQLAKVASGDIWSFAFQWLALAALLRYLKQPKFHWRLLSYALLLAVVWIDPLSGAVFFVLFPAWLSWKHPQGRHLWGLQPWLAVLFSGLLLGASTWLNWMRTGFFLDWAPGRYFLFNLLAILPFLGFAAAGVVDAIAKLRRGEELSLIVIAWMAAALLAQSLLLQAALTFLIARQLRGYFDANYPYRSLVKGGAILQLLFVFFLAMGAMLYGFGEFGGVGFRSAMAVGAIYWMAGFIAVIGLFGMQRRFVWGGTLFGGLLTVMLFWVQLYPLVESRRNVPQRLADATAGQPCRLVDPAAGPSNEQVYLQAACRSLEVLPASADAALLPGGALIAPAELPTRLEGVGDSLRIVGWNDIGRPVQWWVLRAEKPE